jgi:hypothetical protein
MNKLEKFINNLKKKDTFNKKLYHSIEDKYTNGECELLVGYLSKLNNNKGERINIYLIPFDEFDKPNYEYKIFHSVYKYENEYYDINGRFENIQDLIDKLDFFDKDEKILIETNSKSFNEIEKDYYCSIPSKLKLHNSLNMF